MSNTKKGISIYIAVMIMAVSLSIVLGLDTILYTQINMVRNMGYSVVAFYSAETGIEEALFDASCDSSACTKSGTLDNTAQYQVVGINPGGNCLGANYCLESVGTFPATNGTRRAIQVSR
jgi:hypothetical protein